MWTGHTTSLAGNAKRRTLIATMLKWVPHVKHARKANRGVIMQETGVDVPHHDLVATQLPGLLDPQQHTTHPPQTLTPNPPPPHSPNEGSIANHVQGPHHQKEPPFPSKSHHLPLCLGPNWVSNHVSMSQKSNENLSC